MHCKQWIFDMDGTLTDSMTVVWEGAPDALLRRYGRTPRGDLRATLLPGLSGPKLLERFYRRWPQLQPVTGAAFGDGPAVYYSAPGWRGSIGLIAAVHGKFCASCNRVRLTSQGFLRPCLASESGTDLRALLRSGADDAAVLQAIQNTILAKPREHHFGQGSMPATRGMYRIGG